MISFKCLNCSLEIKSTKEVTRIFCSHVCHQDARRKEYINRWKQGLESGERGKGQISNHVRRYLNEKFNSTCVSCNLSIWLGKPISLEVEHIDGNSENNSECNLTLLCPNCHSQTDSYKGANRGKGRHARKQRYAEGKSF
jgi:hypothetical protein